MSILLAVTFLIKQLRKSATGSNAITFLKRLHKSRLHNPMLAPISSATPVSLTKRKLLLRTGS